MTVQVEWMVDLAAQNTRAGWSFTVDLAPLSEKACKGNLSVWLDQLRGVERWRDENGPLMFGPYGTAEELRAGLWYEAELRAGALPTNEIRYIFHVWGAEDAKSILRTADAAFSLNRYENAEEGSFITMDEIFGDTFVRRSGCLPHSTFFRSGGFNSP